MENVINLQLVGCPNSHEIICLLQFFPSLQSFSIIIQDRLGAHLPSGTLVFPHSIEKLRLHFREVSEENLDLIVLGILQTNPQLRRMTITYSSYDFYSDDNPSHPSFEVTIQYCMKSQVEFNVTKVTDEVPDFLDL